jgi:cell division protein FtsB
MRHLLLALLFGMTMTYLAAQTPAKKEIRIVDTLTTQEKAERNPILLRTEIDSLVKLYGVEKAATPVQSIQPKNEQSGYLLTSLAIILLVLLALGWISYRKLHSLSEQIGKKKALSGPLEEKIRELNAEMLKLSKENEGMNRVIREYNGIQHDYESLKHILGKAYKVRNYPGYDRNRKEAAALQGVLDTEAYVAQYAYEKFLKQILAITDAQKNNPAKIREEDSQRLLDLLVSLSFLYIEYLYLRVKELSVGGKMVERIHGFSRGNGLDPALLKKLDTEFGSRALVIRLALNKAGVRHLSYPVFDETNLNYE